MKYDFERIIDDYVFITFLIGNDFIPPYPGLNVINNIRIAFI